MPDWFALYGALWALRGFEFIWCVPRGAVLFRGHVPRRCRVSGSDSIAEVNRGRLVFGNPLDAFGSAFVSGAASEWGDSPSAEDLVAIYRRSTRVLLRAEAALSVQIFFVVPLVWTTLGITRTWPYLLAGVLLLQCVTIVAFARAHAALSQAGSEPWWWKVVPFLLSPPGATASHLTLSKPLLRARHPVEVAGVLCDDESFRALALPRLRRLELSTPRAASGAGSAATVGADASERELVRRVVAARLGQGTLDASVPPPRPQGARSYCPLCHAGYVLTTGECADCDGVTLVPYGRLEDDPGGTPLRGLVV